MLLQGSISSGVGSAKPTGIVCPNRILQIFHGYHGVKIKKLNKIKTAFQRQNIVRLQIKIIKDKRIWIREGNGVDEGTWCGTRTFRINYGRMYNPRVAKGYCYYKYKVTYAYKGKTYTAIRTDWIPCK